MRIVHSSDWHLGRSLKGNSLIEPQRVFLTELGRLAEQSDIDAILVAGDIYDRAIPPTEAVSLLAEVLTSLAASCPIILIPGNHDSALRLGFGAELLATAGVHVLADPGAVDRPVEVTNGSSTILIYGIPYLEPELVYRRLGAERSHASVLDAAMGRIRDDVHHRRASAAERGTPEPHAVVMAHAFITGGTASDSEKDITVGGVADAPGEVFRGMDYVALGHLHGPQQVRTTEDSVIRYSGSPLPYSFSEEDHVKSVTIVEFHERDSRDDRARVTVEEVPTTVTRRMRTITGTLDSLMTDTALAGDEGSWIRAVLTDEIRPERAMERLQQRFPYAIELVPREVDIAAMTEEQLPLIDDPVEVAAAFLEYVTGDPTSASDRALVMAALEAHRIDETSQ